MSQISSRSVISVTKFPALLCCISEVIGLNLFMQVLMRLSFCGEFIVCDTLLWAVGSGPMEIVFSFTFYLFFFGLWLALVSNYLNTIRARQQVAASNGSQTILGVFMWPSAISLFIFGIVNYTWWVVIVGVILMALVLVPATLGSRLQRLEGLLSIQPGLDVAIIVAGICVWLVPN